MNNVSHSFSLLKEKVAIVVLALSLIFSYGQFASEAPIWLLQKAEAATALTAYLSSTNSTTLSTALMATSTAPSVEVSTSTLVGKKTKWGEVISKGIGTAWGQSNLILDPSGKGFILDTTTLEGKQIIAGTWTPKVKMSVSAGSIVASVAMRAYVRSSSGVYTQIMLASSTQTITTTPTTFTLSTSTSAATNFSTGDKLYIDLPMYITTNTNNDLTLTLNLYENGGANESLATPGYQDPPTVSCSTSPSSFSFGTLVSSSISSADSSSTTTFSCTYSGGCTLTISDAGSGSAAGLYKSSAPTYLIPSASSTLTAGTEGYGIQVSTSTAGSGAVLTTNSLYATTGNKVGDLRRTSTALASSSAVITNREIIVALLAAINSSTIAGSYSDTITYSCSGN
ncbi:MAG: hypothetical protein V1489_02815 [Candidatus Liptonbacteria bacterium]